MSNIPKLIHDILKLGLIAEHIDKHFDRIHKARDEGVAQIVLEPLQIKPEVIYNKEVISYSDYQTRELAEYFHDHRIILVS